MTRRIVLVLLVVSSSSALAQPAGAQAEVLFRQGRDLMTAGKVAEACAAFEESQKLEAAVTTLLNLAGCREQNGQLATAWGLFLDAERQTRGSTEPTAQQLHDVAQKRASQLEPRVPKLTITVPAANQVAGLAITRDRDKVDTVLWNRPLPIDGGVYTITARAPGMAPWSTQVTLAASDSKTVEVPKLAPPGARPLEPKPSTTKQAAPPPPPTTTTTVTAQPVATVMGANEGALHRSLMLPLALGGGALVLGGVGLAFELSGESTYNQAKAATTNASRTSLENSANAKRYLAEGFGIAGLGCAGAAVWLYLRGGHADDAAAPGKTTARLRMVPTGTGFALSGEY